MLLFLYLQISGRKKAALQSQIFVVTATYRRTQSELNALIVEVINNVVVLFVFIIVIATLVLWAYSVPLGILLCIVIC